MASSGWSKQPYTRFGIHTMVQEGHSGIRKEGTVRNDCRYVLSKSSIHSNNTRGKKEQSLMKSFYGLSVLKVIESFQA